MKPVIADKNLVAYCGLYCGSCKRYLKGKCPGCHKNERATWCKIRLCCMDNDYYTCADCKEFKDVNDCKMFNNIFSKFFALVFRSDRKKCVERIKQVGIEKYSVEMAEKKEMSLKK